MGSGVSGRAEEGCDRVQAPEDHEDEETPEKARRSVSRQPACEVRQPLQAGRATTLDLATRTTVDTPHYFVSSPTTGASGIAPTPSVASNSWPSTCAWPSSRVPRRGRSTMPTELTSEAACDAFDGSGVGRSKRAHVSDGRARVMRAGSRGDRPPQPGQRPHPARYACRGRECPRPESEDRIELGPDFVDTFHRSLEPGIFLGVKQSSDDREQGAAGAMNDACATIRAGPITAEPTPLPIVISVAGLTATAAKGGGSAHCSTAAETPARTIAGGVAAALAGV